MKYFCKLDLFKAYLQFDVDDKSSKLLTITTHQGTYQMKRFNYSIKTAPAEFNRIMHVFLLSSTIFGLFISYNTVSKLQLKVDAITKLPTPKDVAFLGMVTYYLSFIPNLSTLTAPLHELLKKNQAFKWSAACEAAFQKLKDEITSESW